MAGSNLRPGEALSVIRSAIIVRSRSSKRSRRRRRGLVPQRSRRPPMFSLIFFLTFGQLLANFERPILGSIEANFCKQVVSSHCSPIGTKYQ